MASKKWVTRALRELFVGQSPLPKPAIHTLARKFVAILSSSAKESLAATRTPKRRAARERDAKCKHPAEDNWQEQAVRVEYTSQPSCEQRRSRHKSEKQQPEHPAPLPMSFPRRGVQSWHLAG